MAEGNGTTGTENKSLTPDKRAALERYVRKPPLIPLLHRIAGMPAALASGDTSYFDSTTALDSLMANDPAVQKSPTQAKQTAIPDAPNAKRKKRTSILTGEDDAATYRPRIGG